MQTYFFWLTGKLWVSCPDHCPEEKLEGRLVVVEFVCPLVWVDSVDVDHAEGERDVDDDEDEEENHDVEDHVRHADDYRTLAQMVMVISKDFFSFRLN